jgi:hypothetical protein
MEYREVKALATGSTDSIGDDIHGSVQQKYCEALGDGAPGKGYLGLYQFAAPTKVLVTATTSM